MNTQTLIIFAILIVGAIFLIGQYILSQLKKSENPENTVLMEWLKDMKGTMEKKHRSNGKTIKRPENDN